MSKINLFPSGSPDDTKSEAFRASYEIARREGDRRFGSDCQHKETKDGTCLSCLRKVL